MSERDLELIIEELECSLCRDIYQEPKTLSCLHSFCLECLEIYVERNHSNVELRCPICRTPFQSQSREQLANLSTDSYLLNALNFYNSLKNSISQHNNQEILCSDGENEATSFCLDCQEYICNTCTKAHKTMKISKNHQLISIEKMKNQTEIQSITNSNPQLYCQIHQEKEIELFCEDCQQPICSLCIAQHPSHQISPLSSANIEHEKQLLIDLIKNVKPREKELREGVNKCEEVIKELEINSTTTQTQINQLFAQIRIKLDDKEQELLNKLDEIEKYQKKELELQKEDLKFGIESIIGSCQMIQNSISLSNNNKNDARLLSMKKLYQSRLYYLLNNIWDIEPCHNPFIEFLGFSKEEKTIYSSISNIGIIDSNVVLAEKCLISRNDKQMIHENEEFKFEIISYSKEGNQMKKGGNGGKFKIHIEIEGESNEDKNMMQICKWAIKDLNNGKYEAKIKFEEGRKYSICVQYNGIDILFSPFEIQIFSKPRNYNEINQPILIFGSNGKENGQFQNPYGIAISSKGSIIVCDYHNDRIQIFDSKGNFLSTFGSNGNGNGQFQNPYGIAINSKGNIIISDQSNHRIQIFDSEGNFLSKFGSNGNGNGQFSSPRAICIDKNDRIYVCDYCNNRIQIFDSKGTFISKFESRKNRNGNGQFDGPTGIAINSKGIIFISNIENHLIQVLNLQGVYISKIGSVGQFNYPRGICVDQYDNILVCDYRNQRIQIFNSNREYITHFKVNTPTFITINPKTQNILVCGNDHKVSIF